MLDCILSRLESVYLIVSGLISQSTPTEVRARRMYYRVVKSGLSDAEKSEAIDLLESTDPIVRGWAAEVVGILAKNDTLYVAAHLDRITPHAYDSNPTVRSRVSLALQKVSEVDPYALRPYTRTLVEGLSESDNVIRAEYATALKHVVLVDPRAVEPATEHLVHHLADEFAMVSRESALALAALVGDADPGPLEAVIAREAASVINPEAPPEIRFSIAFGAGQAAYRSPEGMGPLTPHFAKLLEDPLDAVRELISLAFTKIAIHAPEYVAPVAEELTSCLDDKSTFVQRNAVVCLGAIESDLALHQIRSLKYSDDTEVRKAASLAVRRIEGTPGSEISLADMLPKDFPTSWGSTTHQSPNC